MCASTDVFSAAVTMLWACVDTFSMRTQGPCWQMLYLSCVWVICPHWSHTSSTSPFGSVNIFFMYLGALMLTASIFTADESFWWTACFIITYRVPFLQRLPSKILSGCLKLRWSWTPWTLWSYDLWFGNWESHWLNVGSVYSKDVLNKRVTHVVKSRLLWDFIQPAILQLLIGNLCIYLHLMIMKALVLYCIHCFLDGFFFLYFHVYFSFFMAIVKY